MNKRKIHSKTGDKDLSQKYPVKKRTYFAATIEDGSREVLSGIRTVVDNLGTRVSIIMAILAVVSFLILINTPLSIFNTYKILIDPLPVGGLNATIGPAGPAGPAGIDGIDGNDGIDGINGVDGADGVCTGNCTGSGGLPTDVVVVGNITAGDSMLVTNDLAVCGDVVFKQDVSILGELNVVGNVTHSSFTIQQTVISDFVEVLQDITVGDELTVTGTADFNDEATFSDVATFDSTSDFNDLATFNGQALFASITNFQAPATFGNTALFVGTVTTADVTVNGISNFNQTVTVTDNIVVNGGNISVTGSVDADRITTDNDIDVGNNLFVSGSITSVGNITSADTIKAPRVEVFTDFTVGGDITAGGDIIATDDVIALDQLKGNDLQIDTSANIVTTLDVGGDITTTSDLNAVNGIFSANVDSLTSSVTQDATVGFNLDAGINITAGYFLKGLRLEVAQDGLIGTNLVVGNDITASGDVAAVEGDFSGDLNTDLDLTVLGQATVTGNIQGGSLSITNQGSIGTNLTVSDTTITNALQVTNDAEFFGDTTQTGTYTGLHVIADTLTSTGTVFASVVDTGDLYGTGDIDMDGNIHADNNITSGFDLGIAGDATIIGETTVTRLTVLGNVTFDATEFGNVVINYGRSIEIRAHEGVPADTRIVTADVLVNATDSLYKILNIPVKTYNHTSDWHDYVDRNGTAESFVGFLGQDIEGIMPEAVEEAFISSEKRGANVAYADLRLVDYKVIVSHLVASIQELQVAFFNQEFLHAEFEYNPFTPITFVMSSTTSPVQLFGTGGGVAVSQTDKTKASTLSSWSNGTYSITIGKTARYKVYVHCVFIRNVGSGDNQYILSMRVNPPGLSNTPMAVDHNEGIQMSTLSYSNVHNFDVNDDVSFWFEVDVSSPGHSIDIIQFSVIVEEVAGD